MKIAVVDDSLESRTQFTLLINEYSSANGLDLSAECFSDPAVFVSSYSPYKYAAAFLDIYMDGLNGLETASEIRRVDRDVAIVFLTSSEEHRADAFRFHAFDYLTKPVDRARLFGTLDDLFHRQETTDTERFFFTENKVQYSLPRKEVVSVQSSAHYVEITDTEGKRFKSRMNFTDAVSMLSSDNYLLLMRGVLVNLDHVNGFSGNSCLLSTGGSIPVSTKRRKKLETIWKNYKFTKIREDAMRRTT